MAEYNTNSVNNEQDGNGNGNGHSCPPGMKWDSEQSKCMPVSAESYNREEENPGSTSPKGKQAGETPNATPNPGETHDCPPGTRWDAEKGACVETGDPAGATGGGGTGAPEAPGKEKLDVILRQQQKWFENMMAQYAYYQQQQNEKILDQYKNTGQRQLEALSGQMGIKKYKAESVAFGGMPSSLIDDSQYKSHYESSVSKPAAFFEESKNGANGTGFYSWSIRPDAYLATLEKRWMNYGSVHGSRPVSSEEREQGYVLNKDGARVKSEAFTISAGDMPQMFSKQVYLIPGGRMRVPIRQFLDTQIIENSDRYNWYKVNGFDFDDTTAEGSESSNESQTVTKVQATPALKRAVQTVNYSDIENAPFDLIEAFNRAAALGSLQAESVEVLDSTMNGITTPTNWVNANTGGVITDDDVASMTMKQEGAYHASRLIMQQGGDISPGNMVLFAHPKAVIELILDTAADFFTGQNALHPTALGVLENRLGMDIVPNNKVAAQDNTTNDTYRNILAMKGAIGLAVAADLQIEAQRRPDLSAVKVGARHRIKGAAIDETMTARISSAQ